MLFSKKNRGLLLGGIFLFFLGVISTSSFSQQTPQDMVFFLQKAITQVAEKVTPAVVNIRTIKFTQDIFFNIVPQEGLGSGIIFSKDGYILTNEHVISKAREIKVVLPDGREFKGKLIGSDPRVDLAVIKIEAKDIPVAKLGNSDEVSPGQFCIAIGNPFGLQSTITFGVISAKGRHIQASPQKVLENLIQTDAAINPGNSGGPLINIKGEVIGINTAIIPYAQGIGFAIPINTAKDILDELIKYGKVIRPWLGIYFYPVNPQVKERFNLSVASGIYVVKVVPGGPADKGGVREGDVIVRINDKEIKTTQDMKEIIGKMKIGEKVTLWVIRDSEYKKIRVKLEEMPT